MNKKVVIVNGSMDDGRASRGMNMNWLYNTISVMGLIYVTFMMQFL